MKFEVAFGMSYLFRSVIPFLSVCVFWFVRLNIYTSVQM